MTGFRLTPQYRWLQGTHTTIHSMDLIRLLHTGMNHLVQYRSYSSNPHMVALACFGLVPVTVFVELVASYIITSEETYIGNCGDLLSSKPSSSSFHFYRGMRCIIFNISKTVVAQLSPQLPKLPSWVGVHGFLTFTVAFNYSTTTNNFPLYFAFSDIWSCGERISYHC